MHADFMHLAENMVVQAQDYDQVGQCVYFDLSRYIRKLSSAVDAALADDEHPCRDFLLDQSHVARYLWCCLAIKGGDNPAGNTFRGLPIID